jgi:hypothetical protein
MFGLVPRDQPTGRADHAPPRQPIASGQDVPHRPGRAGVAGLLRHVAVGHYLTGEKALQHWGDLVFEPASVRRRSRWNRHQTG